MWNTGKMFGAIFFEFNKRCCKIEQNMACGVVYWKIFLIFARFIACARGLHTSESQNKTKL